MVIKLGDPIIYQNGEVMFVAVSNWKPVFFPLCFWIDNTFCRISKLLDWRFSDEWSFLVETSDNIQILIELSPADNLIDSEHNKRVHESMIYIPTITSEYEDNGKRWENRKKNSRSQTKYPFALVSHFTESSLLQKIENSITLLSSKWSMSGTKKLKFSFCYFTDLAKVTHAWDFFAIAMTRANLPEWIVWENDDLKLVKAKVCRVNKKLDAQMDFLLDMRLTPPNPVIAHFKNREEWWEIFMPNIFRVACDSISLAKNGDYYIIKEKSVNGYKPCRGFPLVNGISSQDLQNMFDDNFTNMFF